MIKQYEYDKNKVNNLAQKSCCLMKAAIRAQEWHGQEHLLLLSQVKEYCSYQPASAEKKDALLFWKQHCKSKLIYLG